MTSPRLGPRPLALHLWAAGAVWLGSLLASPTRATETEAVQARYAAFVDGIEAYWAHPYRRRRPAPRVLWRAGTATLVDHRTFFGHGARPVLLVPSLVNRAYIFDLAPGRSLVAYLAARELAPLVVDWDEPGAEEKTFTVGDYVTRRLEPALRCRWSATAWEGCSRSRSRCAARASSPRWRCWRRRGTSIPGPRVGARCSRRSSQTAHKPFPSSRLRTGSTTEWRVDGAAVRPQALACPALVFVPERDRVVPAASAHALGRALPGVRVRCLSAGHIAMVVGRRAQSACWRPLADWLAAPANN